MSYDVVLFDVKKQITVISGVLIQDSKVLLIQRNEKECKDAHLKWEFPGGKVNFGETPQQALKREFFEETGRKVLVKELLPIVETSYWHYSWGEQQTLCFVYRCNLLEDGESEKLDHHVKQIAWVDIDKIKDLPTLPGTLEIINLIKNVDYVSQS